MKNLFFIFFLLFCTSLSAQKENINWCFSDSIQLTFTGGDSILVGYSNVDIKSGISEPAASISSPSGELQFYIVPDVPLLGEQHKGEKNTILRTGRLYNGKHQLLENGDSLAINVTETNGALIIPCSKKGLYYLFTIDCGKNGWSEVPNFEAGDPRIYIHEIDMNAGNGRGKVIRKNQMLLDVDVVERLTAIKHSNGKDWWLISHERGNDHFLVWLINDQGISEVSVQKIGTPNVQDFSKGLSYQGEMTSSVNGNKIAYGTISQRLGGILEILDFDRCKGELKNPLTIDSGGNSNEYYGVGLSPNGTKLYVTQGKWLYQYNLEEKDIFASRRLIYLLPIDTFIGGLIIDWGGHSFTQMELAPNGKIYVTNTPPNFAFPDSRRIYKVHHLSAINHPDSLGSACGFELEAIDLGKGKRTSFGLPNMPNYNLGASLPIAHAGRGDSLCRGQRVRLGTPPVRSGLVFRWSPAQGLDDSTAAQPYATPDSTTVYRLTVTDTTLSAPCNVAVDDVTVEVLRARASASVYTLDLSKDSTIQFYNDSEGATRAEWDFGNNTRSTDYYPLPVRYQKRGVYRVKLTAYGKNDCSDSAFVTINVVGIPKSRAEASESYFSLYPNPTDDRVYCRIPSEKYPTLTAEIYSLTGVKLKSETLTGVDASFSVQDLPEGIYICKIISPSGAVVKTGKVGVVK